MWATMLHLAFGNMLIGMGEGLLIARVFKLPRKRCVGWMIIANYFSAWVGLFALNGLASRLDWNLYNAWTLFWLFVAGAYLFTMLLEWPLIALCFWRRENCARSSIKASVLAQSASYLLLFGWYWAASGKTLYTQMKIVPSSEIQLPSNLRLFYIAAQSGQICEGTGVIGEVISTNRNDRLLFTPTTDQTNTWALLLQRDEVPKDASLVTINPAIGGAIAADEATPGSHQLGRNTWFNFGSALRLDATKSNDWDFRSGFWAASGFRGQNRQSGQTILFGWETPFANWIVRNLIQLPDDHVIFQLGYDQICVLEPGTRKIALLARGRGPAVLLK